MRLKLGRIVCRLDAVSRSYLLGATGDFEVDWRPVPQSAD